MLLRKGLEFAFQQPTVSRRKGTGLPPPCFTISFCSEQRSTLTGSGQDQILRAVRIGQCTANISLSYQTLI